MVGLIMNTNFAKIEIVGKITVVTGLHIGDSSAYSAIGAVDSPVIKDPLTKKPIIPGSSLKGKMRTLLAKVYNNSNKVQQNPNDDSPKIISLFGGSEKDENGNIPRGKLLFSDMVMSNWSDLQKNYRLKSSTEIKSENSINRLTAEANPRQIERVVRGAEFPLSIIYEISDINNTEEIEGDLKIIKDGFNLLACDYLGGNGSRGYGRVKFSDLDIKVLFCKEECLQEIYLSDWKNIILGIEKNGE